MKQLSVKECLIQDIISLKEKEVNGVIMNCLIDLSDGSQFLQEEKKEGKESFVGVSLLIETLEYPEVDIQRVHSVKM